MTIHGGSNLAFMSIELDPRGLDRALEALDVRGKMRAELLRGRADEIHAVTGQWPALFRAPYGAWSPAALQYCARAGMTPLDWSVDPRDWSRPGVPAIVRNIMRNTRTGSIILEHDGGGMFVGGEMYDHEYLTEDEAVAKKFAERVTALGHYGKVEPVKFGAGETLQ